MIGTGQTHLNYCTRFSMKAPAPVGVEDWQTEPNPQIFAPSGAKYNHRSGL